MKDDKKVALGVVLGAALVGMLSCTDKSDSSKKEGNAANSANNTTIAQSAPAEYIESDQKLPVEAAQRDGVAKHQLPANVDKPNLAKSNADEPSAEEPVARPNKRPIDLSGYRDINTLGKGASNSMDWLSLFFIEHAPRQVTDKEKLDLLSKEYYYEQDEFVRQDLAKQLLPGINARAKKFAGNYNIKVPIILATNATQFQAFQQSQGNTMLIAASPTLQPYNVEKQQFPISNCGFNIYSVNFDETRRKQRIPLTTANLEDKADCALTITDERQARKIEQAIVVNTVDTNIGSQGVAYYQLSASDTGVVATPVYAEVTFIDQSTNEVLATKTFDFSTNKS